ncbi:MAG: hypothetical protein A2017_13140 [Lentisphaerae bacterium GWF2_44_16]|nr:MAG: hypothetical protein A2017_13140 [Lentisphaerae bacterium GWF2_44_16]
MYKKLVCLLIALFFIFSFKIYAKEQNDDVLNKNVLFSLSFDKTVEAQTQNGKIKPEVNGNIQYVDGRQGKAMLFTPDLWLKFSGPGLIEAEEGTVQFWVKPLEYNSQKSYRPSECTFFSTAYSNKLPCFSIWSYYRENDINQERVQAKCFLPEGAKTKDNISLIAGNKLSINKWSLITVTWKNIKHDRTDAKILGIYINGNKIISAKPFPRKNFPEKLGNIIYIGSVISQSAGKYIMDEFSIYKTCLSDAEIWKYYSESGNTDKAETVTIPRIQAPPKIDGSLSENEWENTTQIGEAFLNKNMLLSKKQSRVSLCYDEKKIYMKVDSETFDGALKADANKKDGVIWKDDVVELYIVPVRGEKLYYQVGINSKDYSNGLKIFSKTGGKDYENWDSGINAKSSFTGEGKTKRWILEIALPLKNIGLSNPQVGDAIGFSIARTYQEPTAYGGIDWEIKDSVPSSFAGYHHFENTGKYPKLVFGGANERINVKYGNLYSGEIKARVNISHGDNKDKLDYSWKIFDSGKTLFEDKGTLKKNKSGKYEFTIDKVMHVDPKNNGSIYNLSIDLNNGTFFNHTIPFSLSYSDFSFDYLVERDKKRVLVEIDTDNIGTECKKGKMSVLLENEKGKIYFQKDIDIKNDNYEQLFIPLDILPNMKKMKMKVSLLSPNGELVKVSERAFQKMEDLASLNNKIGEDEWVPPPFTDIQYDAYSISCWNRRYDLSGAMFLKQVLINSEVILNGPVEFIAVDAEGKELHWKQGEMKYISRKCDAGVIEASGMLGNIKCKNTMTLEFDGMLRVDAELFVGEQTKLNKLYLNIPLKSSFVKYKFFSIADENSKRMCWQWQDRIGKVADYFNYSFCPEVWVGDDDKGFSWFAESKKDWQLADNNKAIEIIRKNDTAYLRINYCDTPSTFKAPLKFTFGLQATPVRPRPSDWRLQRSIGTTDSCNASYYGQNIKIIGWGANGKPPPPEKRAEILRQKDPLDRLSAWSDWPVIINPVRIRQLYEIASENIASKPILAAAVEKPAEKIALFYMPRVGNLNVPSNKYYFQKWYNEPPTGRVPSIKEEQWNRGVFHVFNACPSTDYRNFMIEEMRNTLDKFPELKGLYFDGAFPCGCRNTLHGCGYYENGKLCYSAPIWGNRDFFKRLYKMLKKRGADNIFFGHVSSTRFISETGFFDIIFEGEHLCSDLPKYEGDYIDTVPLDVWRAEYTGRQVGNIPILLCEAKRIFGGYGAKGIADNPAFIKKFRSYLAMTLIHDILPQERVLLDEIQSYYINLDSFGHWNAEFLPYWNNQKYVSADSDEIKISLYRKKGRILLCMANVSKKKWTGNIKLNLSELNMSKSVIGRNFEASKPLSLKDGILSNISVEAHDFSVISISEM